MDEKDLNNTINYLGHKYKRRGECQRQRKNSPSNKEKYTFLSNICGSLQT